MKTKLTISSIVFGIASVLIIQPALSHSGRTDSSGCHTNRKTGDYHCHSKKLKTKRHKQAPRTIQQQQRASESFQKSTNKNFNHRKPKINQNNSVKYQEGPYKWEDEGGLHIVFDISKVPEPIRERFLNK